MKLGNPELRDHLAAEYVLGTMQGGARRRFEEYAKRDPALQADVRRWEAHLTPLSDHLPAIDPPARVWSQIEARLEAGINARAPLTTTKSATGLWENLAFWRNLGIGAAMFAAAVLIAFVTLKPAEPEPMLTAVLSEENSDPRVIIQQPKADVLLVKMVKPWRTNSGFSHELWVIPKDGKPRSLGIINAAANTRINLADLDTKLVNGTTMAVSLEPLGGSTTGAPTGRVVCRGSIAWLPAKARAQT